MTDEERLEEVKDILKSPGEVFFGSISEDGVVSQDVADAEPYFDWLVEQAERVQELEEQLQGLHKMYDIRLAKSDEFEKQNKRYRETIKSVRSEIKYALYSNKSEDVKRHYLQNAEREATEALEGEGE